jgi:malate/lactate dehydrogenase
MRRKVTCTTGTDAGRAAALLVAQLDLAELVLVDGPAELAGDLAAAAEPLRYEPRVSAGGWAQAAGSDIVVVDAVGPDTAAEIAARCAGAIVVVAASDAAAAVAELLAGTRLPRARVFGPVGPPAGPVTVAARAVRAVDAILRDRGATLRCAVLCRAEDEEGRDAGVLERDVRVGAGGIQAIL